MGLDTDTDGQVFALVDANPNSFSDDDEFKNYLLERIDLATRTVTKQSTISLQLGKLIAFRRDMSDGSLLIGHIEKGHVRTFPHRASTPATKCARSPSDSGAAQRHRLTSSHGARLRRRARFSSRRRHRSRDALNASANCKVTPKAGSAAIRRIDVQRRGAQEETATRVTSSGRSSSQSLPTLDAPPWLRRNTARRAPFGPRAGAPLRRLRRTWGPDGCARST